MRIREENVVSTIEYMKMIRERYSLLGYPSYQWFHAEEPPAWTPLKKPLAKSRAGFLCTAGTYVKGQVAYYYKDDTSIRAIPKDTDVSNIRFSHLTEQYLPAARKDPNCVFPIEPLRRLEKEGVVGEIAQDMLSCMGAVYSQRRTREELVPQVLENFQAQGVDIAFLVPL
jgi:D-proline reductase (dithiol) PrdB|tara:strand:- start:316 stop:825 length:510 start_codon:yes stop_codon:yes gene_type:complete